VLQEAGDVGQIAAMGVAADQVSPTDQPADRHAADLSIGHGVRIWRGSGRGGSGGAGEQRPLLDAHHHRRRKRGGERTFQETTATDAAGRRRGIIGRVGAHHGGGKRSDARKRRAASERESEAPVTAVVSYIVQIAATIGSGMRPHEFAQTGAFLRYTVEAAKVATATSPFLAWQEIGLAVVLW
jgi:hypothetical protein